MEDRTQLWAISCRDVATLNCSAAYRHFFKANREELIWVAEVILGDAFEAERCIVDALGYSDSTPYVAPNWIPIWVKRTVARIAVNRLSAEIRAIASQDMSRGNIEMELAAPGDLSYSFLRSTPSNRIYEKANPLERAALVLHLYLGFSVPDSALLIGCRPSVVVPACIAAIRKIIETHPVLQRDVSERDYISLEVPA